jgi:hypothetical protein
MRQRFTQVLQTTDADDAMSEVVVRQFWTRAKPLTSQLRPDAGPARVVDLAQWMQSRRVER